MGTKRREPSTAKPYRPPQPAKLYAEAAAVLSAIGDTIGRRPITEQATILECVAAGVEGMLSVCSATIDRDGAAKPIHPARSHRKPAPAPELTADVAPGGTNATP